MDPEEKAFEYLNDRRLYSTLNPRLGLYSPTTIDHVGPSMANSGPKMDGEVTYAELALQRPHGDPCMQRSSLSPSPQPLSLGIPLGGPLGAPLGSPMGHAGPMGPLYGAMGPGRGPHHGPYGPGSSMTLPHPGQRGGLVSCLRRPPGPHHGQGLGHEPTMYAQIAVCRGGPGPGRGRDSSLVEDVVGEAAEAPVMASEHRESSISSLQPLLETRCNTVGGHGKGLAALSAMSGMNNLHGKPLPAVTATRF